MLRHVIEPNPANYDLGLSAYNSHMSPALRMRWTSSKPGYAPPSGGFRVVRQAFPEAAIDGIFVDDAQKHLVAISDDQKSTTDAKGFGDALVWAAHSFRQPARLRCNR
ncbi:MAG: hypothetical protein IPN48_05705 [Sphingomonadales bacterium]|nr:hypothetical protein [Sphingomonadales bacterium]